MKTRMLLAIATALFFCSTIAPAQTHFHITFRGMIYERDASGKLAPTKITEKTLLEEAAMSGGVDITNLALVYHVKGSSFGDTIDVINTTTGSATTLFGFFFGEDASLNRVALTNATGTEVRRVDYLYTRQNTHSMGTGFVTKRYLDDGNGNVRGSIDGGQLQWIVLPENGRGPKVGKASFTTTRPYQR